MNNRKTPAAGKIPKSRNRLRILRDARPSEALKPGDALPSVRRLAAELRINPNTVARAYQDLERDGVISTVPGGGTYVADGVPGLLKSEKVRRLRPYARQIAVEGTQMRLEPEEIMKLLDEELEKLGGEG